MVKSLEYWEVLDRGGISVKKVFAVLGAFMLLLSCLTVFCEENEGSGEGELIFITTTKKKEANAKEANEISTAPYNPVEDDDERTIIGKDDRVTVTNTSKYPYSAIANMAVHSANCGCNWSCSGFMVSEDWLLTAAHCIYCDEHNAWATDITFKFGDDLYVYDGQWTAWIGDTFPNGYDDEFDYAYVHFLDKKVGKNTGWFGIKYGLSDSAIESQYLTVAGYRDNQLKYDSGYVSAMNARQIAMEMDTLPGNSGCPIYDNDYYAVAIFTSHSDINALNFGRRIDAALYGYMVDAGF